jgi:hypothetical protein
VPQALRNRALRRLWRTSDVFEVLDGLNDYDEDFSIAPAAVGAIKSSWQPGRGFAPAEETEADEQTPDGGEGPARQDQQPAPDDAGSGETTSEEVASGDDSPAEDVAAADGETATGDDAAGPGKAKA